MITWKNDRIEKLEARLDALETQFNGVLWFQQELMLLVKEFTNQTESNFPNQKEEENEPR